MVLKRETLLAVGNVEKILLLLYTICVYKYVCDTFLVPNPTLLRVANFSSVHTFSNWNPENVLFIYVHNTFLFNELYKNRHLFHSFSDI